MPSKPKRRTNDLWIILIGLFKLLKAISLVILAIGLLKLVHRDVAASVTHWVERLRLDPDNEHIHRALARVFRITPKQLKELSAGTFIYAGLFMTEGVGLLMRKRWAEYFTIISTAVFIPLEVYEIFHRFTWTRTGLLTLNVAIVWYLWVRVRGKRQPTGPPVSTTVLESPDSFSDDPTRPGTSFRALRCTLYIRRDR